MRLPDTGNWTKSLHRGQVSITSGNLLCAQKVFDTLKCEKLGDYYNLYLLRDILLLACVFESFRKRIYSASGFDKLHYCTCSHLSGDAFLRVSIASVESLSEREHLENAEKLIKGGVASVFSKLLALKKNDWLLFLTK